MKLGKIVGMCILAGAVLFGAPAFGKPAKAAKAKAKAAKQVQTQQATGVDSVNAFLTDTKVFFLATVDGNRPRLRPLGMHFVADGKLLFGVGDFKDVYKQMQANPQVEIVALKDNGHWLRYWGKAVFETDPKYAAQALEMAPNLKEIYNDTTGHQLGMFHLEDATALDIGVMGEGDKLL